MKFKKRGAAASGNMPNRRREQLFDSSSSKSRASTQDLSDRYTFRRNRTITGSSSAQIMSSNELNADLRSPRAHVHHLTSLRRRLLLYFAIAVTAVLGLYILLSQMIATEVFQVKNVPLLSDKQHELYQATMEEYFGARPAERLRFALDEKRLTSHMQAEHPEIQTLSVEQSKIGEAVVSIVAREPLARWSIASSDQYVDGEGVVFANNFYAQPSLQIVDESGVRVSSGQLVASNRFLAFIGKLLAAANQQGMTITKVTLPLATTRQVELTTLGKVTKYKVSVDRSAGQQVEDISRIIKYLDQRGLAPAYVDVRLQSKAFYK